TPAEDVAKAQVIICGTNGPGDTQSMAHEKFAEELNKLGDWEATAMVSSEMGSTDDVLEQAMAGAGVIAATDPARLASYVPEFGILMMPYMFDSYDQLDVLLDTPLYAEWSEKLEQQGLQLLTNNCITGFRNYVTKKEVMKPADLDGLKIRTMGSPIAVNSVNAMGAIATSMAQSDAYNAIETGVVDGGEWQIPTIYSLRMYEVCDHISLTKHFLLTGSIVCGSSWYNNLTERQQQELKETAIKVYGETKEMVQEYEEKYMAEMQEKGMTVDEPDLDAFREATDYLYSDDATTGGVDFVSLREELYSQMGIEK
ncbi:MAG: C4-dicarboxylate TRAP transporter substrate-binding protein, partial [Otoolea sp.]